MRTLIVGRGQVGSAVAEALSEPPATISVPWADRAGALATIATEMRRFLDDGGADPWALCWSAGAGVVGTPRRALDDELAFLAAALDVIDGAPAAVRAGGRMLLASSAGGIHAGNGPDIVTEATTPTPRSDYGEHKLRQEAMVARVAATSGVPALLCRISNVYGPSQNMSKSQGFISHLCRAILRRESFVLTVPPDTVRDFILSRDVGRRIALWLEEPQKTTTAPAAIKLLVSGRSTTLHHVIGLVGAIARVPARITISPLPTAPDQAVSTRFKSVVGREMDIHVPSTTLEEGVHQTWQHLLRAVTRPQPAAATAG